MVYDFIIIGAGPAGSILGKFLGEETKHKVLIIDNKNLTDRKNLKSCGGLLSPSAQKQFADIGVTIPKDVLEDPQLFAVDTIDVDNNLNCLYQRYYYNMDRNKFDLYLNSRVPENVKRVFGTYYTSKVSDDNVEVTYFEGGVKHRVYTKYLVGADGGNSKVRRIHFANRPFPKRYVAIQKWYNVKSEHKYYVGIFNKKLSDYYSWSIPKNDKLLVGGIFELGYKAHEKYDELESFYKQHFNIDLGTPFHVDGAFVYRVNKLSQLSFANKRVFLIGEASGAISPTSAEGFSYAIKTAKYLYKSLGEGDIAKEYNKKANKIRISILFKLIKYPGMYHRLVRKFVMRTKIGSIN